MTNMVKKSQKVFEKAKYFQKYHPKIYRVKDSKIFLQDSKSQKNFKSDRSIMKYLFSLRNNIVKASTLH